MSWILDCFRTMEKKLGICTKYRIKSKNLDSNWKNGGVRALERWGDWIPLQYGNIVVTVSPWPSGKKGPK